MTAVAIGILLLWAFGSSSSARSSVAAPPQPGGGFIPGVPADLQRPVSAAPAPATAPNPVTAPYTPAQQAARDADIARSLVTNELRRPEYDTYEDTHYLHARPLQADPPGQVSDPSRLPRVSTAPAELPSSPELRRFSVARRAQGRTLALAAATAVRGRGRSYDQGPVRAFQEFVGIATDGLWGRQTAQNAALWSGQAVPRPVY